MNEESVTLYFTQGTSDKVYAAHLLPVTGGWRVMFSYGRRGGPQTSGTKTKVPVDYEVAKKAYDQLVRAKMSKGYTPGEDGVAFTGSPDVGIRTDYLPQLLNQVTEEEALEMVGSFEMFVQTKHDGDRRGILFKDDEIIAANRKGLVTTVADPVLADLKSIPYCSPFGGFLDTEDMGDHLVVFDAFIPPEDPEMATYDDMLTKPFFERAGTLFALQFRLHQQMLRNVIVDTPTAISNRDSLVSFIKAARGMNEEGIVIRDGAGVYAPGKPNSGGPCFKLKFREDATVRVHAVHPTKRSIRMEVKAENGTWWEIGNCTIPVNKQIPAVGVLVDVGYLYAHKGGSLFQPTYKGPRTDLEENAATILQLKYKKDTAFIGRIPVEQPSKYQKANARFFRKHDATS